MRSWERRLEQFDRDLETEPERIRRVLRGPGAADRAGRARLPLAGHELTGSAGRPATIARPPRMARLRAADRPGRLSAGAVRAGAILDRATPTASSCCASASRSARRRLGTSRAGDRRLRGVRARRARLELLAEGLRRRPTAAPIPEELEVRAARLRRDAAPDFAVREREPADGASTVAAARPRARPPATTFDRVPRATGGSRPTPHGRMERLLRETGVPAGLLFNGRACG